MSKALPWEMYRDPLEVLERKERSSWRRKRKCAVCTRRPELVGGNGACKVQRPADCRAFDLDEEAV